MDNNSILFKEKRKWQIALRRYILEKKGSYAYAEYFGLDIKNLRKWIECQFDNTMSWDNFAINWQFDHILPASYFDLSEENDQRMYWNFINLGISALSKEEKEQTNPILMAKKYFEYIYQQTQYPIAQYILQRIDEIENKDKLLTQSIKSYIEDNKQYINTIKDFAAYEFDKLNSGTDINEIIAEQALLKRFS